MCFLVKQMKSRGKLLLMFMQILEVLTVGFPFCIFKILTGNFLGQYWLVALGVIDAMINLVNLLSLIISKKRILDTCFLSMVVHRFKKPTLETKSKWQDLGNAIDLALSFIFVAYMVGADQLKHMVPLHLNIWNISVVFNVLGAGLGQLTRSIKNLT